MKIEERYRLTWADLSGANLTWANLTKANLSGADLGGEWVSIGKAGRLKTEMRERV